MRICSKLRSRKGETLTETLVAVLLVGLASVVLASMIGAASRMSGLALERDKNLYEEITAAETQKDSGQNGDVTIKIGGSNKSMTVTYYGEEGQLNSYAYKKGGGST